MVDGVVVEEGKVGLDSRDARRAERWWISCVFGRMVVDV